MDIDHESIIMIARLSLHPTAERLLLKQKESDSSLSRFEVGKEKTHEHLKRNNFIYYNNNFIVSND